jgi:hypothetical protein
MTGAGPLVLEVVGTGEMLVLQDFRGIVAGYTGRDEAAVQHHIDELASIGIAPPPAVPMFYGVPPHLFSTTGSFSRAGGSLTSGEIEPLYVRHRGRFYLGIGSDHTDRDLERTDIGDSKRACPKPIGARVIAVDDLEALSLDDSTATSWVDGSLYQRGSLAGIRTPANVVELLLERTDVAHDDFVCLGGTLPLHDGGFVDGDTWRLDLQLADGTHLEHTYTMEGRKQS